jgi:hypothetical protein
MNFSIADLIFAIGVVLIGIAIYFLTKWEYALLYTGLIFILSAIFLSFGEGERDDTEQDSE